MAEKRPPLSTMGLGRHVAQKGEAAIPAEPSAKKSKNFRFMQTRLNIEGWRELTHLSTDQERSLQSMMIEAVNDLLGKYGRPKVAAGPDAPPDKANG
jgi:Antitoxin-like ribbon-helix-helix